MNFNIPEYNGNGNPHQSALDDFNATISQHANIVKTTGGTRRRRRKPRKTCKKKCKYCNKRITNCRHKYKRKKTKKRRRYRGGTAITVQPVNSPAMTPENNLINDLTGLYIQNKVNSMYD